MKEISFIAFVLSLLLTMFFSINKLSHISCKEKSLLMNKNYNYTFISGCMIKDNNNNWIPIESLRSVKGDL